MAAAADMKPDTRHVDWTVKTVCEALWRTESAYGLLDRTVAGIRYWPLIRPTLFNALIASLGVYPRTRTGLFQTIQQRVVPELHPIKSEILALGESWSSGFDSVLLPFPRKQLRNGQIIDIHSERLLEDPNFGKFLILDRAGPQGAYRSGANHIVGSHGGLRLLSIARAIKFLRRLSADVANERDYLTGAIFREFGLDCPLSARHIAMRIAFFHEGRSVMGRALKKSGAKRLFIVGNHAITGVVAAARDLGMDTIEVQHGALSPYHVGYHYPGRPVNLYMPDRFLSFGPFWTENTELPGSMAETVIGSDNLTKARKADFEKVRRRVVAFSQMPTDWRLYDAVLMAARNAPDWDFIFRPHPWEDFGTYQSRFAAAKMAPANFRLSGSREDMYALLASAELQIGVFSTSLFEGMVLGARTIILDLPGAEVMEGAVRKGDAVLTRDYSEIIDALETAPLARDCERYYARPVPSIFAAMASRAKQPD